FLWGTDLPWCRRVDRFRVCAAGLWRTCNRCFSEFTDDNGAEHNYPPGERNTKARILDFKCYPGRAGHGDLGFSLSTALVKRNCPWFFAFADLLSRVLHLACPLTGSSCRARNFAS